MMRLVLVWFASVLSLLHSITSVQCLGYAIGGPGPFITAFSHGDHFQWIPMPLRDGPGTLDYYRPRIFPYSQNNGYILYWTPVPLRPKYVRMPQFNKLDGSWMGFSLPGFKNPSTSRSKHVRMPQMDEIDVSEMPMGMTMAPFSIQTGTVNQKPKHVRMPQMDEIDVSEMPMGMAMAPFGIQTGTANQKPKHVRMPQFDEIDGSWMGFSRPGYKNPSAQYPKPTSSDSDPNSRKPQFDEIDLSEMPMAGPPTDDDDNQEHGLRMPQFHEIDGSWTWSGFNHPGEYTNPNPRTFRMPQLHEIDLSRMPMSMAFGVHTGDNTDNRKLAAAFQNTVLNYFVKPGSGKNIRNIIKKLKANRHRKRHH